MDMSRRQRFVSGPLAVLVVGLVALGCMVFAEASVAAVPPTGLACQASDGKINGRGATVQNHAETAFAEGFENDFCGPTPKEPADVAGSTMVAYNYPSAVSASATGNGAALKAASCRTDAFEGASAPYTEEQLKELDEAPEKLLTAEGKTCASIINGKFTPPFEPNAPEEWPDKQAGKEDSTANIMTIPITGFADAIPVNLPAANCGGTAPANLEFNAKELSRIFGGEAKVWNETELIANNPSLANCSGAIIRVVRSDTAGQTDIFKQYLIRAENERTGSTCAPGKKWEAYLKTDTQWPGLQSKSTEGGAECSEIVTSLKSGGAAEVERIKEFPNGVGYVDLSEAEQPGFIIPEVLNATATAYEAPNEGDAANCNLKVVSLPGSTPSEAVGLNLLNNWGNNNEINGHGNHQNATDEGSLYPICGVVFDLVFTGLDNGAVANPISRLTADQCRTLYSYVTYQLTSTAQSKLTSLFNAPLPAAWLPIVTKGFQSNF
jgi:ABC-type phosphate transport system substrate-binding protein